LKKQQDKGILEKSRTGMANTDEDVDHLERRTMNLWPNAGRRLGLGKNQTYQAAARGEIPGLIKIGHRFLVLIEPFEKFLKYGPLTVQQ
jgi:hypothetical protein